MLERETSIGPEMSNHSAQTYRRSHYQGFHLRKVLHSSTIEHLGRAGR